MKGSLLWLLLVYLPVVPLTFGILVLIYRERPHPPDHFWRWLSHEGLLIGGVILAVITVLWLVIMVLAGALHIPGTGGPAVNIRLR